MYIFSLFGQYLSFLPHRYVCPRPTIPSQSTPPIFWTKISLDGSIRWRKWGGEGGIRGTGEGGWGRWGDDGPSGTQLKCSSLSNLLLYFETQQEGCRRRSENSGDGWSDVRALTDLMNGISTLAKWLHHHERDRGQEDRQKALHY